MLAGISRFDLYRRGESTFTSPPPRQHQPHAIGDNLCLKTPPLLKPRPVPWPPPQKPVTEDEMNAILDRLAAVQHIFRENRELREVLFRREGEAQKLRSRNAELEEIMRKLAPILLSAATTIGLAAKNENSDTLRRA